MLARRSGETTQAVIVRALTEHVAAANRYRSFLDDAKCARVEMQESGVGYAMREVHAYILGKARGGEVKRPRKLKESRRGEK